jgi:predicted amidohydrolase
VLVTLAQLMPRPRDVPANLARVGDLLADAPLSDLIVLPELFLCGYELSDVRRVAIELDSPVVAELSQLARSSETAIVVGAAERLPGGVANSALCLDGSGRLAAVYRKTHLFGAEQDAYIEGDELVLAEAAGRVLGLMICFDMEFPEVARTLGQGGADLLVTISANCPPFELDHDVYARARALENGLPHVYVNRVGEQDGVPFTGGSLALDPEGHVLAEAGRDGEQVLTVEIGAAGRRDPRVRYPGMLRPSIYSTKTPSA